jgi:pimeloyl-ACP methyl ester carboxylesterase
MTPTTRALFLLAVAIVGSLATPAVAAQHDPSGTWTGRWERDGSTLTVEMTFTRSASGYEGTFSSPQLRVVGIPFSKITYEAPLLRWELVGDATTMVFEGTLQGDTLSGRFREGTAPGTFTATRAPSTHVRLREDEVAFANGPVTLAGTVVIPAGAGPFPGIVFLHGSGAEGRWATRYLAEAFARRGVAALVYDKRGVGRSTGDWRTAGFEELVGDAVAAVDALRARPEVAPDRVGIHGHSQGGTIAPWVATASRHVAFVVASAPGGGSMAEMEIYSLENSLGVAAMTGAEQQLARRFVRAIVATAYEGAPRSDLDRVWGEARTHAWAFEPPPESHHYWAFSRRIAGYDPLAYWRRVTVPALVLFGEADERVPPRPSAARIADAYLGAKGLGLAVILFPLADHNYRLRPATPGRFEWPRSAPGYPDHLIAWVLRASA